MNKVIVFLVTLTFLVTAVTAYVFVKAEAEKPQAVPVFMAAGQKATFVHPKWSDTVVFEKNNRMYRETGNDWATVTSYQDGVLTVSWDRWDVENYKKSAGKPDTFELSE